MEEISVKNKKYLKAKVIARELGYTTDYVGQLCRAGKVDAELVGRTWYVDPESIKDHKGNRYRSSKASTARTLHADVKHNQPAEQENFYSHRTRPVANYESDEADLLPQPAKKSSPIELQVELADAESLEVEGKSMDNYHFTAPKREETKFFGTLKVTEFLTEVPVGGEEELAQPVTVSEHVTPKPKATEAPHNQPAPDTKERPKKVVTEDRAAHTVTLHRLTHKDPQPAKPQVALRSSIALPISGDSEAPVSLPVTYHLITLTSVVTALLVAAVLIGLETTVTATAQQITTDFSFAIHDIMALIYLVK